MRYLALLAALALPSCAPAYGFLAPPPEAAVVKVLPNDTGSCTGFHIGHGLIATAGHCVKDLDATIQFLDGSKVEARLAAFLHDEVFDDLAVFQLVKPKDYPAAAVDCGPPPPIKTEIYLAGYPANYVEGLTLTWGRVSGTPQPWLRESNPYDPTSTAATWHRDVIPVNVSGLSGVSGGPVFSVETGQVVGILVGAHPKARDLDAMVPAARLCELLDLPTT